MTPSVSTSGRKLPAVDLVRVAVPGRVVRLSVEPAAVDHAHPGAGQDPDGVRVVVAPFPCSSVEIGCPGVGLDRVAGEVADGVAELFVAGPSERHDADLSGLAGGRGDTGQADQRFWGGEFGSAVADLGEQPVSIGLPAPRAACCRCDPRRRREPRGG